MTNIILFLAIILFIVYAIYDQVLMDKQKGKTLLSIRLKRQSKMDAIILVALIALTISQGIQTHIEPLTIYLLATCIVLAIYSTFIRYPRLLLKEKGFFFANIYIDYKKIKQLNLAEKQILVVDLTNERRLLVKIEHKADIEKVVNFFGGYKS
ncbi:DUF986 family protein [Otariodibacter oris]|uniref:UPF0266 membrane protein DES31_1885 n=1 Tax=Otariodibacter oris TaxID=1032623 RepID=A0A420XEG8_9PAST|nr:DUF986 family protein [Otariodibacter oris]QGM80180.1 hypothetical protein A6A10_01575 [Otariodibacter oris]RKR70631.1 uncharacterized membrane protein YobD (UPF0266 family) [Otariodibacter oris]